ncbi:ABC transporter ATP-binding protein [Nocardioides aequoreus]|uniref:ABC transporter ATP-binding protein n=1 Tax=Nocardioides aequoreus TaxID=397278 RepID=UPI0004C3F7B4|nr:ABC transporter ATP-binding protein [Nocardioides aequoreus]
MIEATGVWWSYGATPVLDEVDVVAADGRVLGLIGPNGSGKTTLLRLLHGGLHSPTGSVRVDGTDLGDLAPRELARRLAVVVQEEGGGDSVLTAGEMVLLGRTPHLPPLARARPEDHRVAAGALARVGALHLAPRPLQALSGGERQRVLIARALAQQAGHLLLDEPTNHLDIRYQHEVLALLRHVGGCCVVVLHDLDLAARYCDDLLLLDRDGRVVASGPAGDVLDPDLLEPVYGLPVRRLEVDGEIHLVFRPADPALPATERTSA